MSIREVVQSPIEQGADEIIFYQITTTPWASSPSSPTVQVFDLSDELDVTSTVMPSGSASVASDVITLPALRSLTSGEDYRVEVKFVAEGNTWEAFFVVKCRL